MVVVVLLTMRFKCIGSESMHIPSIRHNMVMSGLLKNTAIIDLHFIFTE